MLKLIWCWDSLLIFNYFSFTQDLEVWLHIAWRIKLITLIWHFSRWDFTLPTHFFCCINFHFILMTISKTAFHFFYLALRCSGAWCRLSYWQIYSSSKSKISDFNGGYLEKKCLREISTVSIWTMFLIKAIQIITAFPIMDLISTELKKKFDSLNIILQPISSN